MVSDLESDAKREPERAKGVAKGDTKRLEGSAKGDTGRVANRNEEPEASTVTEQITEKRTPSPASDMNVTKMKRLGFTVPLPSNPIPRPHLLLLHRDEKNPDPIPNRERLGYQVQHS